MQRHKRILVITPFYPPNIGGAESFCFDLVKTLAKQNQVTVCTIDWGKNKTFKGTGIKQFIEVFPRLYPLALKMTRQNRFDKVFGIGLQATAIAASLRIPVKYSVLLALYDFRSQNWPLRAFSGLVLNRMDKVFVEGENGKADIAPLGIKKSRVIKFQHWCDQTIFKPGQLNRWKIRVLFVGRAIPEKGKHIIESVERRLKHLKNLEFIYVENCKFKDLPKYYQVADVVCVPSLYLEGIPRVVIESASCGCAVIASNRGTLPELIKDFGIVIEPTVEKFEEQIRTLYKDQIDLMEWQMKSLRYAQSNFNIKNAEIFLCE